MSRLLCCLVFALLATSSFATTITVPSGQPTIQMGINTAQPGDTVLVAPGTYSGEYSRDLDFDGKTIILISEGGPEVTIIDCQADVDNRHRGFLFHNGEDSSAIVEGFTITGGHAPDDGYGDRKVGGAIYCDSASSPTIRNCIMYDNHAYDGGSINCYKSSPKFYNCRISNNLPPLSTGGAVFCNESTPLLVDCEFIGNHGLAGGALSIMYGANPTLVGCLFEANDARLGGAVYFFNATALFRDCVFRNNTAEHGGAIHGGTLRLEYCIMYDNVASEIGACLKSSEAELINCTFFRNSSPEGSIWGGPVQANNCILAFSAVGPAVKSVGSVFNNTNIYGNRGGDWDYYHGDQAGINGNFSVDPRFCDTADAELSLWYYSPCLPEHSGCGLVGAGDRGCIGGILPVAGMIYIDNDTLDYAVRSLTPTISWLYTDTLATSQQAYELEMGTDDDWSDAEMWATGPVMSPDTFVTYSGTPLIDRTTYHLRIRLEGDNGWGSWTEDTLLVRLPPTDQGSSDWPGFQYNAQYTGYNDRDQITVPLTLYWSKRVQPRSLCQPTVVGDRLAWSSVGFRDTLYPDAGVGCVDARSGDSLWGYSFTRNDVVDLSQVLYHDGDVYFQIEYGPGSRLWCCDLESGQVRWKAPYVNQVGRHLTPQVAKGIVVMNGGKHSGMYGFDAVTGAWKWHATMSTDKEWAPAICNDTVYTYQFVSFGAHDLFTGTRFWNKPVPDSMNPQPVSGQDLLRTGPCIDTVNRLAYLSGQGGVYGFDLDTRSYLWKRDWVYWWQLRNLNVVSYDTIAVFVDMGKPGPLIACGGRNGEVIWEIPDTLFQYHPVAANGLVFAAGDSTTIAVDILTGKKVWSCDIGGELAIANNSLYITAVDGWIYCYGPMPTEVEAEPVESLPTGYALSQNYPNPFNPTTEIRFTLPKATNVRLDIYNILGQRVTTLIDQQLPPGEHTATWNAERKATGIYLYRLQTDDFADTKKMVLIK